jgi:ornithine cyclodeaminase/alanine dehydrogenase-like protein (mu-crystallin family)
MLIINAEQARSLLPMAECIDAMEPAMIAASNQSMLIPPRTLFQLQDDSGFFAVMPGASEALQAYGAKVVSYHPANAKRGRPPIQGFVTLFDHHTGEPRAIIDGNVITNVRTAAASGLATRCLARPDSGSCGIFGAGALAEFHIEAMCQVRPIERFVIWARNLAQARTLADRCSAQNQADFRATNDPQEAAACDVICTTTASPVPVVKGEWIRPGAHINLVGAHKLTSREADTGVIVKARVYVDLMESTRNEGGDIMIPIREGAVSEDHVIGEIGQLLTGGIAGRLHEDDITVYNSLGITSQDIYAALHVLNKALETGVGTRVTF